MTSVHKVGEMLKCEQCHYKSASKGNMKAHVEVVHERIRKYSCGECDYAAFRKDELKKHKNRCKYSKVEEEKNHHTGTRLMDHFIKA